MARATDVVPQSRRPTLGEWFNEAVFSALGKVRVCLPGRVETYDPATQLASVKPLLEGLQQKVDGSTEAVSVAVVNGVPVVMPQGGGRQIKLPVAAGDVVLLVFADRSIDIWKSKGGEVDPVDLRQHHLSDAIAIPCVRDPAAGAPSSTIEIKADGSILLGAGASHPLIFGDDFSGAGGSFDTLMQAIATAVGTSGTPAGATASAAAIVAAITAYRASVLTKLSANKTA